MLDFNDQYARRPSVVNREGRLELVANEGTGQDPYAQEI